LLPLDITEAAFADCQAQGRLMGIPAYRDRFLHLTGISVTMPAWRRMPP
jgi:hypothetical protein